MKITITVDTASLSVVKKDEAGVNSTLLIVDHDAQSVQEIAALVARIAGTEVAAAMIAAAGGE